MNRKVLLLAGAISALFAGKSSTTTAPPTVAIDTAMDIESIGSGVTIGLDYTIGQEQTPVKPAAQQVAQRTVELQNPPMFPGISRQFIERPMRRKVKYGKNRWVILG